MLSESYKSSLGLSEITTKCKRLHLNLQMWALLHLFGLFSVVCIPFIRILLIRLSLIKYIQALRLSVPCSACLFVPVPVSGGVRLRRKPEMNYCSTVICSLFRRPARLSVPQSICRGHSRKGLHGYPGGSRSSLCLDINQKKVLVVSSIILDIHY